MRRIARAAIDIIRLTFAREKLGEPGGSQPAAARRTRGRFLHMLVAIEPLPMDPPAPPRSRRFSLAALLAREPLPLDPVAPPRRRTRLAALFAPESLDEP